MAGDYQRGIWGMSRLKAWWDEPDQFDAICTFLRQRGLLQPTQLTMVVVAASAVVVPISELVSQHHPTPAALMAGAITVIFIVVMAIFWLTRWPTRRQSATAAVMATACIGAWTVTQANATMAALACTASAVIGGYIAFFHSTRLVVFNAALAGAIATAATLRLANEIDVGTAIGAFWVIVFLNVSAPLCIRGMSRAMCTYAARSDEDPLTGLLNRRGFIDAISLRLAQPLTTTHTHLAVLMVDLDNFKWVNDTHGHAVGDSALVAVADLFRECLPPHAAMCRAGGEEFVIALTSLPPDAALLATRLCSAIASLSFQVTASIGAAVSELPRFSGPDRAGWIEQLIAAADAAMYAAKRNGGNQAQHA
ncbi:MAG: GGDEF domain-containing protein [Mycobacterium sp.]|uniref:GGDEF domain-containing protein n=1 Tax=Mycobacterium sp. TaxID=1785 RepID=UPI003F98460F